MTKAPCTGRFWRRTPGSAAFLPAAAALAVLGCTVQEPDETPSIRVLTEGPGAPAVEVHNLDGLTEFRAREPGQDDWQSVLALFVVTGSEGLSDPPAVLGEYEATDDVLRLVPRYGLAPGVTYRARLDASAVFAGSADPSGPNAPIEELFSIPPISTEPTTVVDIVFPSADVLPENTLKFYIHFSSPMAEGRAYEHVRLLDSDGDEVEWAFLELGEELWDPTGTRFTLLFDPGRIKRGLQPRLELGPSLEQGNSYTLFVDRGWTDAIGLPLKSEFRKEFSVIEPAMGRIEPSTWRVIAPKAGTQGPLVVDLQRSMDRALLQRMIWVATPAGEVVPGEVSVEDLETRWVFTPLEPWNEGAYELVMDTTLEDVSGNKIKAPFDVDVFEPGARRLEIETTAISFRVNR